MPPHEKFEQEVRRLVLQECIPLNAAIQKIKHDYPNLVNDANTIFKIKQKIARDLRN